MSDTRTHSARAQRLNDMLTLTPSANSLVKRARGNILCLGYQKRPGISEVIVTDVLCFNFPPLEPEQLAELSRVLEQQCNRWRDAC